MSVLTFLSSFNCLHVFLSTYSFFYVLTWTHKLLADLTNMRLQILSYLLPFYQFFFSGLWLFHISVKAVHSGMCLHGFPCFLRSVFLEMRYLHLILPLHPPSKKAVEKKLGYLWVFNLVSHTISCLWQLSCTACTVGTLDEK